MPEIEGGRWDGLLRKLLNISAPRAMPAVADEMIPTFEVQNWEPELYALRRERLLAGFISLVGVAAQFAHVGLSNPPGSNTLVIVEKIEGYSFNNLESVFAMDTELATSLGWLNSAYVNRDLRWPGGPVFSVTRSVARLASLNAAVAQGDQFWRFPSQATGGRQALAPTPIILAPDSGVLMRCLTVNESIRCNFAWRERPFNPQERP